tara:strand:- start:638 stop:1048 length:411 start_codon:yes stop_codon:yes gene_type:complete
MKDDPKAPVALRMDFPYNISIIEPEEDLSEEIEEPVAYEIDDDGNAVPADVDIQNIADIEAEEDALYPEEDDFEDEDGIKKMTGLDIDMRPWAPLSKDKHILIKLDDVVSAYETFDIVVEKYNELVEAAKSGPGSN